VAALPAGTRISDYISLGVVAKLFRLTDRPRQRDLPAHGVVYCGIALALYMRSSSREVLRGLWKGWQCLLDPSVQVKVARKSRDFAGRSRLGAEPRKKLYDALVARPWRRSAAKEPGTGNGSWLAWTAALWMWADTVENN
jgi:hypothetical protein